MATALAACQKQNADVKPDVPKQPAVFSDVEELSGVIPTLDHSQNFKIFKVHPVTKCSNNVCDVLIGATIEGRVVLSPPLNYKTLTNDVAAFELHDENKGAFALGPTDGRYISAWNIGGYENGVSVAVEVIRVMNHTSFLIHESAGFEHVKRTHSIIEIENGQMQLYQKFEEGPSPDIILVYPLNDEIIVEKINAEGQPLSKQILQWTSEGRKSVLELVGQK